MPANKSTPMTLSQAQAIITRANRWGFGFNVLFADRPEGTTWGVRQLFTEQDIREQSLENEPLAYYVDAPGGLRGPEMELGYLNELMDRGTYQAFAQIYAGLNPSGNPFSAAGPFLNIPAVRAAAEAALRSL